MEDGGGEGTMKEEGEEAELPQDKLTKTKVNLNPKDSTDTLTT